MALLALYCWIGLTIGNFGYEAVLKKKPDWATAVRSSFDHAVALLAFVFVLSTQK